MVAFNNIREFDFIIRNNIFYIRDLSELLRIDPTKLSMGYVLLVSESAYLLLH